MDDDDFFLDTSGVTLADEVMAGTPPAPRAKAVEVKQDAARLTPKPIGDQRRTEMPKKPEPTIQAAQRSGPQPLYFDLETVPDYSRLSSFGLEPVPPVPDETDIAKLPDPGKTVMGTVDEIEKVLEKFAPCPWAWLEQLTTAENAEKTGKVKSGRAGVLSAINDARSVRGKFIAAHDERRKLLSTTPEYCSIAALGWAVGNGPVQSLVVGQMDAKVAGFEFRGPMTEAAILQTLWELIHKHAPLVGFNVLSFDLPVIFVRSSLLGVASSRMLDLKAWGRDVLDVYAVRFPKGGSDGKPRKLKQLAPLYGIEVPAGDCEGSQVEKLLETDPAKLGEYVRSDVEITRAMHRKLAGYFWQ